MIRLLVLAVALAVSAAAGVELVARYQGVGLVLPTDLVVDAERLAREGRWAESKMLAEFVVDHPRLGDAPRAAEIARRAGTELDSFWGTVKRFTAGALSGEPKDTASMLGALSLDLFVIGDVRDLVVQGWKKMNDGQGDNLILALSAVGLTTTLLPEIHWAPAMLKAYRKAGALSRPFVRVLKATSRKALKTGDFRALRRIVTDLGQAGARMGPGPLAGAMRSVDSAGDLAKLSRAARLDARGSYVLFRTFGKGGVRRLSTDGGNIRRLVGGIKVGGRAWKIGHKVAVSASTQALVAVLAGGLLVSAWMLLRRRRRRVPLLG